MDQTHLYSFSFVWPSKCELRGLRCPPQAPLQTLSHSACILAPLPALSVPALAAPGTDSTAPATSEADCGVKWVFHLPLTWFLRTLQWYYCLTVLTLSHLAASQITPYNTVLSWVMNKTLFHRRLSCTFSLNLQSHHTFPIQISPKNSFVPSRYKLKIIIKALGYPFLWVSQWPWLTAFTESVLHSKKWAHCKFLETNNPRNGSLCSSSSPFPQPHPFSCISITVLPFCYTRNWRAGVAKRHSSLEEGKESNGQLLKNKRQFY